MQRGLQTFAIKNFKGVRNWENPQNIPPNYLFYAQNSNINGGRWRSKLGGAAYLDPLVGGSRIRTLLYYPYQVASTVTDYVLEYYNSAFYLINTDDDTRAVVAGTTFTTDEDTFGMVYNNEAYVVSPNNGMAYLTGTTWSTTFTGTPPAGTMMEINSEKMWVAGVPGAPAVVFYSRSASAANPEYIRDWTDGSGSALLGKGGYITAIKNLKQTLYVFKNDSIYYLTGFSSDTVPIPRFEIFSVTAGCINPYSLAIVENDIWFLTPSLEIRSLGSAENFFGDNRTYDVSLAIKRYINQLDPDQHGATMSYFQKVLKISMRTAGSPVNNFTLEYDLNDNSFTISRIFSQKFFVATNIQRFFGEDGNSGQLYKDDVGYTNNGSTYDWNGRTFMLDLNRPDLQKRVRYLEIYLGRSVNQAVNVNLFKDVYDSTPVGTYVLEAPTASEVGLATIVDDGAWATDVFGGSVWGGSGLNYSVTSEPTLYRRVFKIDINQTGRMFGVELQSTIDGGVVEVEQINFQYIVLPEKNKFVDL